MSIKSCVYQSLLIEWFDFITIIKLQQVYIPRGYSHLVWTRVCHSSLKTPTNFYGSLWQKKIFLKISRPIFHNFWVPVGMVNTQNFLENRPMFRDIFSYKIGPIFRDFLWQSDTFAFVCFCYHRRNLVLYILLCVLLSSVGEGFILHLHDTFFVFEFMSGMLACDELHSKSIVAFVFMVLFNPVFFTLLYIWFWQWAL